MSFDQIAEHEIPLPPLEEQRRIVEKLEKLLAKVEGGRDRIAKIPMLLKRFRESILANAYSGRLTVDWREENHPEEHAVKLLERLRADRVACAVKRKCLPETVLDTTDLPAIPETWSWATLDQIVEEGRPIIYGIIKPGPHDPRGVPYVRVFEMKDGNVAPLSELKRASIERASKFTRATLNAGDLLISKDGTIGKVAVVPPELESGNITQHLVRASIHPFLCRDYIVFAIRSQESQNWLVGEKKGVALQGVNVEDFRRLPLPIPPLAEQQEIARRVEALFGLADKIDARYYNGKRRLDGLTQSLLAKAFKGELVPTEAELAAREGREFESASQLLDRIKAADSPHNSDGRNERGRKRHKPQSTPESEAVSVP